MIAVLCQADPNCPESLTAEQAEGAGSPCLFDRAKTGPRLIPILLPLVQRRSRHRVMGNQQEQQAPVLERVHMDLQLQWPHKIPRLMGLSDTKTHELLQAP
jgi:hypothetical protein